MDGDPDRRMCAGMQDLTDDVPCPFLASTDDRRRRSDCIVIIPFRQQVCQIGRMMCRRICSGCGADVVLDVPDPDRVQVGRISGSGGRWMM